MFINSIRNRLPVIVALLAALLVSAVMLLMMNINPLDAYHSMVLGAFGTENATAETLVKAIPILFVATGICIAFRGGIINVGGEGQMIMGALAGVSATIVLKDAAGWIIIIGSLIAGFTAGALYGGLVGVLKAYFNVNEVLSTIMLNQVSAQIMNFLLNGPLLDPAEAGVNKIPKTARIPEAAELPRFFISLPQSVADLLHLDHATLFDRTRLHYGLVIAIGCAVITYVLLWRTIVGYRIRAVGYNPAASRYAGIRVQRYTVLAMLLAGGLAGLAGVVQVLGLQFRLQTDGSATGFTGNAGFNGIVAALFGGLNPFGAIPASILFGGLLVGAQKMQRDIGVSASLVTAVNGIIVLFIVSSQYFVRRGTRFRANQDRQPVPVTVPPPIVTSSPSPSSSTPGE
ncbi:MAG TPA: ABC transporter permease [Phototrophicaceae bacterium]|jgi:simple sugar transport system permease protein|nr:ABC transporter permease [Phototrophicaceae bacterium]